jgi:hypothetical protein
MLMSQSEEQQIKEFNLPDVEMSFEISGQTLPADHGYGL